MMILLTNSLTVNVTGVLLLLMQIVLPIKKAEIMVILMLINNGNKIRQ